MNTHILVLAYNRPEHLRRLLESLSSNPEAANSSLTVSIDGPKNYKDRKKVDECETIAQFNFGFNKVTVIKHKENSGLSKSVINAVTKMFLKTDKLIVVEDDLVVSQSFLSFMNLGLEKYEGNRKVASIQGYQYPEVHDLDGPVFLKGADCWGWATWRDRWEDTVFDSELLISEFDSEELIREFDFDGTKPNYQMLIHQSQGKINSWAIRWHASQFLQNKLSLFPQTSFVQNLGTDGSGTNSGDNSIFDTGMSNETSFILPDQVVESMEFREQLKRLFAQIYLLKNDKGRKLRFFRLRNSS